ncbi:MAG: nucleoside hydrolase [Bacteroidales bacterium]|nr:nucleoside hydrolase [Bacteroidales bacterium]
MKKTLFILCAAALCLVACKPQEVTAEQRINIIFDTDIGNDIDDTEALCLLNRYIDQDRINLLGICLNKEGENTAKFVDIVNTFYGHADMIPVGRSRNNGADGSDPETNYAAQVSRLTAEDGSPLFKTTGIGYEDLPDSHILYRKLLAEAEDNSVVVISVGFLTNLARLLDTPADEISPLTGKELIEKKVKMLSIMAGRFKDSEPEYNVVINIPSAKKLFSEWPGEIVCSPWEIGEIVRYPAESIENDYEWAGAHPLKEAYIRYGEMPYDNWMFDPTSVLFAVEGDSMCTLTEPGTISVDDEGVTTFTADPAGKHRYFTVDAEQAKAMIACFKENLTAKPACWEE